MKTIGRDFGDTARKVYAVASGALGNGKTCVVNTDGTVSVVNGSSGGTGSATQFESSRLKNDFFSCFYDSDNQKIIIMYSDEGDSSKGKAVVGTVSGTSISFGSIITFRNANTSYLAGTYVGSSKVLVQYRNEGTNNQQEALVGTVSGTSISFGSPVVVDSGAVNSPQTVYDVNANKVVLLYADEGNSQYGSARVGTVSGTTVSFGTVTVFESAEARQMAAVYDSTAQKIVTSFRDGGDSNKLKAIVGTVSGTSISFGSATTFENSNNNTNTKHQSVYDSVNNRFVVFYIDVAASNTGNAVVGTVSGTSISFGTPVVFLSAVSNVQPMGMNAGFDPNSGKIFLAYAKYNTSSQAYDSGFSRVATVSGTTISFTDEATITGLSNSLASNQTVAFDTGSGNFVTGFQVNSSPYPGAVLVHGLAFTTLTSENYIGITPSAYPTGAGAEIQTKGAVNEEQSGLTAGQSYFVQTDGTLSTTAGDPSVFAGTAVSATKIIVKG